MLVCEIECKLVARCRPQCRVMPYRQVIYDLAVAGREKGDARLSQLINKRCSGAHVQLWPFYFILCLHSRRFLPSLDILPHLWLSLFLTLCQRGAWDFDTPADIYRNTSWNQSHGDPCCLRSKGNSLISKSFW